MELEDLIYDHFHAHMVRVSFPHGVLSEGRVHKTETNLEDVALQCMVVRTLPHICWSYHPTDVFACQQR